MVWVCSRGAAGKSRQQTSPSEFLIHAKLLFLRSFPGQRENSPSGFLLCPKVSLYRPKEIHSERSTGLLARFVYHLSWKFSLESSSASSGIFYFLLLSVQPFYPELWEDDLCFSTVDILGT